ncbi:MAG TPA: M15 family metallopeptidase [Candidatus Propionivibrio aalborgensis]|nr:M15 family metallopeptidase [Candidatus Propionivibrio aalborgensis]
MNDYERIPEIHPDLPADAVAVDECGEDLCTLTTTAKICVAPAYHARGFTSAPNAVQVRTTVRDALHRAALGLPTGLFLLVWDGLRTLQTQREIAQRFAISLRLCADEKERETLFQRYVSPLPKSLAQFTRQPPPHATGGAVDLSLCDADGNSLDLGAEFDQFDENAWLTWFEHRCSNPRSSRADNKRRRLRRILYWAMVGAGFAPYAWEYWHFELNTRAAAAFYHRDVAAYGPAVPWSGNSGD